MPTRTEVIQSLLTKYNSQIEQNESGIIETAIFKFLICQLVDTNFGGGSGGGSTSPLNIATGVNQSTKIIDIAALLASIDNSLFNGSRGLLNQAGVTTAINNALDIDTLISKLTSIDNKALLEANIVTAIESSQNINSIIARLTPAILSPISNRIGTGGSELVVAQNPSRRYFEFHNDSASPANLNFGSASNEGVGFFLSPGEIWFTAPNTSVVDDIFVYYDGSGEAFSFITGI
jgi:hypothetical protein